MQRIVVVHPRVGTLDGRTCFTGTVYVSESDEGQVITVAESGTFAGAAKVFGRESNATFVAEKPNNLTQAFDESWQAASTEPVDAK